MTQTQKTLKKVLCEKDFYYCKNLEKNNSPNKF